MNSQKTWQHFFIVVFNFSLLDFSNFCKCGNQVIERWFTPLYKTGLSVEPGKKFLGNQKD